VEKNRLENFVETHFSLLTALCAVLFFSLCFLHYLSPRPFHLDESIILSNLQGSGYFEFFHAPLKGAQIHPRIHLSLMKFSGGMFDFSTKSVRLIPFIFMTLGYFVWRKNFFLTLETPLLKFLAVLGFSCTYHLMYYAAEAKPYSADVFTAGAWMWFYLYQKRAKRKHPKKEMYFFAALMPFLLFFSNGGIFVVWIAAYNYFLMCRRHRKWIPVFVVHVCSLLVCAGFFYYFDLRHGFDTKGMKEFWGSYFLCVKSAACFMSPWWEGTRKLAGWWFESHTFMIQLASPFIPLFLYMIFRRGICALKRDDFQVFSIEALGLIIYLEMIILGILKQYPFVGSRMTLFFAPIVIYLLVKAVKEFQCIRYVQTFFIFFLIIFFVTGWISSCVKYLGSYF
jgi:hypothetical protein